MAARHDTNRFRVIGGSWRGRKFDFPDVAGLRPTPDRVRETLFNWLAPEIEGARCLDLFAGSGALGIEALSRGAAECVFVDRDPSAADAIRTGLSAVGAGHNAICCRDGLEYLDGAPGIFDIVFLDPPFHQGLLLPAMKAVAAGWVEPGGRVYIEHESGLLLELPDGWTLVRDKQAGAVVYGLIAVG